MSCNKDYSVNFISERSSTRIHHAPGGGSSVGSLIFGGDDPSKPNKENANTFNQQQPEEKDNDVYIKKGSKHNGPLSDAEKVREFTFEAGQPVPDKPKLMNLDEVNFITKMILDELLELYGIYIEIFL